MLACYPLYILFDLQRGSSSDELLHPLDLTVFIPVADYQPITSSLASGYELRLLEHFVRAFHSHLRTLHLHFLPYFMIQCFCEALKGQLAPLMYLSGSKRLVPDCDTKRGTGYHRL